MFYGDTVEIFVYGQLFHYIVLGAISLLQANLWNSKQQRNVSWPNDEEIVLRPQFALFQYLLNHPRYINKLTSNSNFFIHDGHCQIRHITPDLDHFVYDKICQDHYGAKPDRRVRVL